MVARCLNTDHIRGMGKYVYELLSHGRRHPELQWRLFGDDPRYGMVTPDAANAAIEVFPFRGDRFRAWEQVGLPMRLRRREIDVLHATEGALALWQPKPTVVTVHDTLAWEERPDTLGARTYWDYLVPAALKKCAAVITISESSRNDILARWPWLEPKLTVIPHGIDEEYFRHEDSAVPEALARQLGSAPYLVYLGGPMKRKRPDWAIEVLAASRQPGLKLVMCGFGSAARKAAQAELAPELRGRVLFAEFLQDPELRALYRGAQAVLYPTLYEGFGFPALEAQAAGTPVLFSALGSLKELIGPLAMVVPPNDCGAWVAAIEETATLGEARARRARAAADWARRFAWSESFGRHLAVYRQVGARP
jgi:glycosyltransferase involved in cell wall biosynthesis